MDYEPKMFPVNFKLLLDQVNKIRLALAIGEGKLEKLPPGKMHELTQCVLARALSNGWVAEVDPERIRFSIPGKEFEIDWEEIGRSLSRLGFTCKVDPFNEIDLTCTKTMKNFIYRFDEEQFPELILKG